MPASSLSPWQQFKTKWESCSQCPLCEVRRHVVLARGNVPCDILFVGEAPGQSEDVLGVPFVGPAGHLLDKQVEEALLNSGAVELRLAFTNLVCCIPKESRGGQKVPEPSKEYIGACAPRLDEFMCLCKPKLTVAVGDLAEEYLAELADVKITHPAAILRAMSGKESGGIVRQALMDQRVVVILENAFRDLV